MKKYYKIEKLVKYCFEHDLPIFPTLEEFETEPESEDTYPWYVELKTYFDNMIDLNYEDRVINRLVEEDDYEKLLDYVQKKIALKVRTNVYQFSKLYETTVLEYNPLWNVDGVEVREIEREKDGSNTRTFLNTDTMTYAGSQTNTRSGNETSVDTGTDVTTKAVTTFDDSTFRDTERTTEAPNNKTNTHTYNSVADTETFNNRTDTNAHTGTIGDVSGEGESTTETLTRQGNIGVTKSTDLIDSQRETVRYSYVEDVVHILVNDFTFLVD